MSDKPKIVKRTRETRAGTQITDRVKLPSPLLSEPCQAIVTTQVVICEPWDDGTWRPLSSFDHNYNIVLNERGQQETKLEFQAMLEEAEKPWKSDGRITSLTDLLTIARSRLSKTEPKPLSSARPAEKNSPQSG